MNNTPVKEFFKTWGWLIPAVMIPLAVAAADSRYVLQVEAHRILSAIQEIEATQRTWNLELKHHLDQRENHVGYERMTISFVPRNEISQVLDALKEQQERQSLKLDRLFEILTEANQ
jgi:hypothetical protein